jgi:bacterioferritin
MSRKDMGKERLIEILNDLVAVEIAAVTEYQQHAYLSDDPKIIDLLESLSMNEMSHIEYCSREVVRLGGLPTVVPKEVKHAEKTSEDLVKRDIEVETEAMERLKDYIKVAEEEGDRRVQKLLKDIYADEATHYDTLNDLLHPQKSTLGKIKRATNIGTGLILTGLFWLYFWVFPWFQSFVQDPRWAHNFAYPLILIIIGIAYYGRKLSTDLVAVVSAFMIIPTESGVLSGLQSTYAVIALLIILLILLAMERGREQELMFFQHRWRRWFKKHFLIFAFLFMMHMAFIYWFSRAFFGEPVPANLPNESALNPADWATATYNILVLPLGLIGMAEKFRGTLRRTVTRTKLGYWWSLVIITLGIAMLGAMSGAWRIYGIPLAAALVILILSIIAYSRK